MLPESTTVEAIVKDLPNKIRIYALAKLTGTSSKELIAEFAKQGIELKSAQSSVTKDVAETYLRAQESAAGDGAVQDTPAADAPASQPAAQSRAAQAPFNPFINPFTEDDEAPAAPVVIETVDDPVASGVVADPFAVNEMLQQVEPEVIKVEKPAKADKAEDSAADSDEDSSSDDSDRDSDSSKNTRRRRRRGRRGRGRSKGDENTNSDSDSDNSTENQRKNDDKSSSQNNSKKQDSKDSQDSDEQNDSEQDDSPTLRRRRRRRRSDKTADGERKNDDPPNTVVHERTAKKSRSRSASDQVQSISGSTRLEAKRQRRREGRQNARNRIPVLSEAEFLARREEIERVMVVREKERSDHPGTTTQVGVLEDNILVEHFVTSDTQASMVGNIYLGRVQNVLPSMEAAFIDIGRGRNAVLYAGEINWAAAGLGGKSRKIEHALSNGDQILVQVSKDPIAHKGARLTTQVSMAGRYLVYVPDGSSAGISRKLPVEERKRLRGILKTIVPEEAGVIIRTAAEGASEEDLKRDIDRLHQQWLEVKEKAEEAQKRNDGRTQTLHEEPTMLVKVVRDLFNDDFSKLVVEGDKAWNTITTYMDQVDEQMRERLEKWDNTGVDVFQAYRVDEQLAKALDRKVWLPSGGSLVIDRTEAMTVIDVNTGKFTGSGGNLEETVTRNNLEAAEEIVRQLRLRDIGGIVIVDFIDMVLESNRDLVLRRLREALGRDRTRHQVSEVTSLGLVQMTRKRLGTGLLEAFSTPCKQCSGSGYVLQEDPVEAVTSGTNAEDTRSRRRRGRKNDSDNERKSSNGNGKSNGKQKSESAKKDEPKKDQSAKADQSKKVEQTQKSDKTEDSPTPQEHPMVKAMERSTSEEEQQEKSSTRSRRRRRRGGRAKSASQDSQQSQQDTKQEPQQESKRESKQETAKPAKQETAKTAKQEPKQESKQDSKQDSKQAAPQKRGRKRRATHSGGTVKLKVEDTTPEKPRKVVAGVLPTAPIAVKTDKDEQPARRPRRRVARSS